MGNGAVKKKKISLKEVLNAFYLHLTQPSAVIEPGQRLRVRLLAAFLLLMVINTFTAAIFLKAIGGNLWLFMLAVSGSLLIGYLLSRSRLYRAAMALAVILPVIPPAIIVFLQPPQINLMAEFMWLALPLLAAGLLFTLKKSHIVAITYICLIIILGIIGPLKIDSIAPLVFFFLIIAFFVIAFTARRKEDLKEIEKQLTERERIEKSLKESEEMFFKAFQSSPDAISIARLRDGVFLQVNDSYTRITGYTRRELLNRNADQLDMWADIEERYKMVDKIRRHVRMHNEEVVFRTKSGERRTMLVSTEFIQLSGEPCIMVVSTDITDYRRTQKALSQSEEQLAKVFRISPQQIVITRMKDGKVIDVNDSYTRLTGFTREDVIGRTSTEIGIWVHPEDRRKMLSILKEKGHVYNEEFEFRVKSGEIRTKLFSAEPVVIDGEPCLVAIATDITEKKLMENALKESQEKLSKAFNASPDAISITTVDDGTFLEVNGGYSRVTGYSREELIGHYSSEFDIWVTDEERQRMIEKIKNRVRMRNEEFQLRTKSGDIRTMLVSSEYFQITDRPCVLIVGTDITEYKRTEKALHQSEQQLARVFHLSPQQIIIARMEDGKIIDVNDSFVRISGYSREEIIGHTSCEMNIWAGPEDRQKMLRILKEKGHVYNEEFQFQFKSGETRTELFSAERINLNGEECLVEVITDITERKRMEQALRESEEKFSKAFRSIPESVAISTLEEGVFIDVNENFCRVTGLTHDQIVGHTADELNITSDRERRQRIVRKLKEQGRIINEELAESKDSNEPRYRLFSADIIELGGVPCMLSVSTDITHLKRLEKSLADEAVRRRILIEQSRDGIVIQDQNGTVFEVNQGFADMLGYTREEIKQMHVWDWNCQQSREEILESLKSVGEAGSIFETRHRRKDGSIYDVEIRTNGAIFAGQKLIFSVCRDITERKAMEKALRESEEKFSKAFHAVPESIAISRLKDGVFIDVNNNFLKYRPYKREEVIGHTGVELKMWEKPEDREIMIKTLMEKGSIVNEERVLNIAPGIVQTILFTAEIISIGGEPCVITINNDITELKRMEQALRESEEKFSKAFHAMPGSVTISRIKDGVFIDVNENFCHAFNCTRDKVIGFTGVDIGLWKNTEERNEVVEKTRQLGGIFNEERTRQMPSGKESTVLFSSDIITIGGEPCLLTISNDITERKKAEEKLKQALTELEQSSTRLKATNKELESFSYSVSHDLRAPLRAVDGFSQALLEDYAPKLDETARDYLRRMRNASQKMGELIDGLLKLSRLTRGEMQYETVDLSAIAREIAAKLQEASPERKAKIIIQKGLKVNGDPQMLRVMLENLLDNAWKFTQKVPETHIELGRELIDGKKTFFIRDNGAGFDMSFKDKLFGAFQRLHSTADFPGTGIGLATVQRIINRHGGTISAAGEVGRGAVFYFTLEGGSPDTYDRQYNNAG